MLAYGVWQAGVAQRVEQLICNQRVGGSNPFASSSPRERAFVCMVVALRGRGARVAEGGTFVGRFPSGQREQTVNLPPLCFGGSNPPLPTTHRSALQGCGDV